jgi:N-acetylglucosaminyldiphosphoundecaprenol N-acetyl-beta-D-mannosaminyltransferase
MQSSIGLAAPSRAHVYRSAAIRLLGVRIDCLRLPDLLDTAVDAVRRNAHATILYVNVHCMNVSHHDREYRCILERADVVYCDGEGVRLGAWLAGQNIPERMTGADWIEHLCAAAVREDLSLFLLGGEPGVADDAATILQSRHPGLRITGTGSGYGAGSGVIQTINRCRPDILLVGMGTPTQEKWIEAHRAELDVPVVWAVGALFDFVAGRIPRGPRWMTQHGLEWLCRLTAEPRKLWRRYLVGNPRFLMRVIRHYYLSINRFRRPAF